MKRTHLQSAVISSWMRRWIIQVLTGLIFISLFSLCFAQIAWEEGWDSSTVGSYVPLCDAVPSFVQGQKGNWLLGDTISCDEECGPTQNRATIFLDGSNRKLRLTSVAHNSFCADNVWLTLDYRISPVTIPINSGVQVAFTESGSLVNPQWNGAFPTVAPPPGDNVHLRFMDNNGNMLVYLFQRAPDYFAHSDSFQAQLPGGGIGSVGYHEVLLGAHDAPGGTYVRDLHADFSQVPGFTSSGSSIIAIVFEVTNVGEGTLDDLKFGSGIGPIAPTIVSHPQSVTTGTCANVTFEATADGTPPIHYQWHKDTVPIAGAQNPSLSLLGLTSDDEGGYSVVVTNSAGEVTSDVATLTVTNLPPLRVLADSLQRMPDGRFRFLFDGSAPHSAVDVLGAAGPSNWALLASFTNSVGTVEFIDPNTNLTQRFYQLFRRCTN